MANKNKSFDLGKYQSKKEKSVKVKKEKPEKIKKEKPLKIKQKKAIKLNQNDAVSSAPKKVKSGKSFSVGSSSKLSSKKKSIDLNSTDNAKKRKLLIIAITLVVVVLIAVAAVIIFTRVIPEAKSEGMEIDRIEITKEPEKLVYIVGEEADYSGLQVRVTRKNGESFIVLANQCEISGFSSAYESEIQYVTVSYQGFFDSYSIKILAKPKSVRVLKSISLDPMPKTEYKANEWLNVDGAVMVREYMDGTVERVNLTKNDVYGFPDKKAVGEKYTLTVKYAESGVLRTFDYQITVTE